MAESLAGEKVGLDPEQMKEAVSEASSMASSMESKDAANEESKAAIDNDVLSDSSVNLEDLPNNDDDESD